MQWGWQLVPYLRGKPWCVAEAGAILWLVNSALLRSCPGGE